MLDDFREASDFVEEEFEDELEDDLFEDEVVADREEDELVFGMTPVQRLVLALLFFLSMCMLGTFCLLVTDKIALPLY